jgi:uncharacterized membrane protein
MSLQRDTAVDTLRGIAIFTMVGANLAGAVLIEPHSLIQRLYGTFAAPFFILLSGMMVSFGSKSSHNLRYYLIRMGLILAVAVLIDVLVWGVYPFIGFDVLYLIGISMPIVYLSLRLNLKSRLFLVAAIFAVTPLLQFTAGYVALPSDSALYLGQSTAVTSIPSIMHHWLIDGWFPIFPWIGVALLGPVIVELRRKYSAKLNNLLLLGLGTLAVGAVSWWLYPGDLYVREGYSEMFYPATIGFLLTAIGLIITLFALVDRKPNLAIYKPLQTLGAVALFSYILHEVVISYVFFPYLAESSFEIYLLTYVALLAIVMSAAYGLKVLKSKWTKRPFLARFLIG